MGDYTPYSDCDFIVVTQEDLTPGQLARLQALHKEIHSPAGSLLAQRSGGVLRPGRDPARSSTQPRDPPGEPRADDWGDPGMSGAPPLAYPFWYSDYELDTLVRSEHDNRPQVRWCLREKGVVLAGPDPATLVDPVSPAALKAEVRKTMDLCVSVGLEPMHLVAWQAFWVGLFCRILHTMETGTVTSKKAAMTWPRRLPTLAGAAHRSRQGAPERATNRPPSLPIRTRWRRRGPSSITPWPTPIAA